MNTFSLYTYVIHFVAELLFDELHSQEYIYVHVGLKLGLNIGLHYMYKSSYIMYNVRDIQ